MKKLSIFFICFYLSTSLLYAQFGSKGGKETKGKKQSQKVKVKKLTEEEIAEQGHEIVNELDNLDAAWHEVADELGTYAGLTRYCTNAEYKTQVNALLDDIHHYDQELYRVLMAKKEIEGESHKLKITLKEIEKVEDKYRPKNFNAKLNDDCKGRSAIEKDKKKLKRDIQMESYDGKALVLDNDIHTYIKHITHLVDLVDKHAHHLLD